MRKRDIFGRKVDTSKPLYYLIIIFTIAIAGYFTINYFQTAKLLRFQEEQSQIQISINNLLYLNQESSYQDVDELLPHLPSSYNEAILYNELQLVKNLSGLSTASTYQIEFSSDTDSPFSDSVDADLRFVKIEIGMTIDDYNDVFDFISNLDDMDRLYYIDSLTLSLLQNNAASISMTVYTFYMTE